jgi:hypothetical protein
LLQMNINNPNVKEEGINLPTANWRSAFSQTVSCLLSREDEIRSRKRWLFNHQR